MKHIKIYRVILIITFFSIIHGMQCTRESKDQFIIKGEIAGLKTDSVYLFYEYSGKKISAPVVNGTFSFSGQMDFPDKVSLQLDKEGNNIVGFFLENSRIKVEGTLNDPTAISVSGSESNDDYMNFQRLSGQARRNHFIADSLMTIAMDRQEFDRADSLDRIADSNALVVLDLVDDYALSDTNSAIIPYILQMACFYAPDKAATQRIMSRLPESSRNNPRIGDLNKMLEDLSKTEVGIMAPEFEIASPDGEIIKLSSFRGKVILVDFWASWCAPCIKSLPEIRSIYDEFAGNKFEIIGFSIDKNITAWEEAVKRYKLQGKQVVELQGADGKTPRDFGIVFIPTTFLIDKQGRIAGINLHGKRLRNKIIELLSVK